MVYNIERKKVDVMKLVYPAIFTPCAEKEGYTVEVPDLPGCVTEGSDLAEAIEMGIDAASGWVLGELEDGNNIPAPSSQKDIHLEDEQSFVSFLVLDMDSYADRYGNKAVRKNITIPAWLNTYGEKNNINFSKVLQDALLKRASN
ncbi:MAG: type II toxin-antitoxin system HicB family antitoxin [Lachnospira sp.]